MKIIILGPPGSGKGTISENLVKDFSAAHISPGEILREEVRKETTLGFEIKKYIEKGNLVPNQFVVEIVKLEIKELSTGEITNQLNKSRLELVDLRMKFVTRQLEDTSVLRKKRKEIAHLLTVQTQNAKEKKDKPQYKKDKGY